MGDYINVQIDEDEARILLRLLNGRHINTAEWRELIDITEILERKYQEFH